MEAKPTQRRNLRDKDKKTVMMNPYIKSIRKRCKNLTGTKANHWNLKTIEENLVKLRKSRNIILEENKPWERKSLRHINQPAYPQLPLQFNNIKLMNSKDEMNTLTTKRV